MKITCGTDIIEIQRIKEAIEKSGDKFLSEIFTEYEISYCKERKNAMYQHFAARFAAKEAIFKSISYLLKDKYDLTWKNAEIIKEKDGKPTVKLTGLGDKKVQIDLSISHCKEYAVAMVVTTYMGEEIL